MIFHGVGGIDFQIFHSIIHFGDTGHASFMKMNEMHLRAFKFQICRQISHDVI